MAMSSAPARAGCSKAWAVDDIGILVRKRTERITAATWLDVGTVDWCILTPAKAFILLPASVDSS